MKMRTISKVFGVVILAALMMLSSCGTTGTTSSGGSSKTPQYTIALINGDNIDPYFLTVWHGASDEANKLGVKLIEEAPATFDYETQAPLVSSMIARHVNALILSADATGNSYNTLLAQAHQAHIPVILVNETQQDMNDNPNALSFITSENTALASLAGQETASLLHGHGTVGVINSSVTLISDLHRVTGFTQYLATNAPGIKVLPQQIDGDSVSKAAQLATDLMEAHPDLTAIYAVDSFGGQGVATAVKAAGKVGKVSVIAIDAEPQEVTLLKEGVIQALVAQQPYSVGTLSMQYAYDALTGHTASIQRSVNPPGIIVTPQNVDTPAMQNVVYQTWTP